MKKLFFSALLAAVAVGGAFASSTLIPAYAQIGGACKAANTIQTSCTTTNTGAQCTASATDGSGIGPAYETQSSPFLCAAPLKRP